MYDEFDDRDVTGSQGTAGSADPNENDAAESYMNENTDEYDNNSTESYENDFSASDFRGEENNDYYDGTGEEFTAQSQEQEGYDYSQDYSRQETEPEPDINHAGVVQRQTDEKSGFYHYSYQEDGQQENGQTVQLDEPDGQDGRKPPKDKGKSPLWKRFALCAGMAAVFGVVAGAAFQVTGYVGNQIAPSETEMTVGTADTVLQTDAEDELQTTSSNTSTTASTNITQVAENAMPSIVAITSISVEEVQSMFFGQSYTQQVESAGSGVIVSQNDAELLIATNNHVVSGAEELSVCFTVDVENDEDAVVSAQVKGTDAENDLAIVAVNLSDIPDDVKSQIKVIQIGSSDDLVMGQQVIAIGNALGYGQSLTVGYVSALDREVSVENDDGTTITLNMIQTDAAINAGNSGGALLNTSGELVGINSVKAVSEGVEGMGYAIPIDTAQPILDELMSRETRTVVDSSEMGFLGVTPRDVSDEAMEVYNMPAGAFIYEVEEGSAADEAGIQKGDIITKFDGITISSSDDLYDTITYYKAGETIDVVVATAEGGEYVERTVSVTLGERPADTTTTTEAETEAETSARQDGGYDDYYDSYGDSYGYDDSYSDDYSSNPFSQFFN